MRWTRIMVMAIAATAVPVSAQSVEQYQLTGMIGRYRVGANLSVRNDRDIVAAHYFYASTRADIPLAGNISVEQVTLRGTDGGVFDLHFETNDTSARRPFTFKTSTALAGSWTRNGQTLPVHLSLDSFGGPPNATRYQGVTDLPAPAFEATVARFLRGATTGNRGEAASAISFPLTVHGAGRSVISNRAQLDARWSRIFTPCIVAKLRDAIPHEMFVRNGSAMVADGAVWFHGRGATVINQTTCAG